MESEFNEWAITDGGLSLAYAGNLTRALGRLRRSGADLAAFTSAEAARAAVRPALADLARRGKRHSLRLAQKALTHYARFRGLRDQRGDLVAWELAKVPRRRLDPYLGSEVAAILDAVKPGFKGLRQAAMLWVLAHTGLRKAEVWSLQVGDLDRQRGAILLRRALKDGQPRWVNVPDTAWDPAGRLQAYLAARPGVPGPLWVSAAGQPLTIGGFTSDLYELRPRSGVGLNFNRWRHTRGTLGVVLNVPEDVQQGEWGHGSRDSTAHYRHGDQGQRREALAACGMPGYLPRQQGLQLVRAMERV